MIHPTMHVIYLYKLNGNDFNYAHVNGNATGLSRKILELQIFMANKWRNEYCLQNQMEWGFSVETNVLKFLNKYGV